MLTSQDVVTAYRLILGREPESATIIDNYVNHSDFDGLRNALLGSSEFAERLSREPHVLPVPMVALTTSQEVRRYKRLVESLASLGLPIHDNSVLVLGEGPASLTDFFLERRCRVSVAAPSETKHLLEACFGTHRRHAANMTVLSADFGQMEATATTRYGIVYGELPDDDSDVMRAWLDNTAEACSGTLILLCKTAPGRSEEIFVTRSLGEATPLRTVATRRWILSRLRERYEHVYEEPHAANGAGAWSEASTGDSDAIFVASRETLSLPTMRESPAAVPRLAAKTVKREAAAR